MPSHYVKRTDNPNMGRPKKVISSKQFEELCKIQCTKEEIISVLGVCEDTLDNWLLKTYGSTFLPVYKKYSSDGKASLRRYQFALAEKNPTMAIWLGKQMLGQTDKIETVTEEKITFVNDVPKNNG